MSFGEVYTAERPNRGSVSSRVSLSSDAFRLFEGSDNDSSISQSQLGKALSAHFLKYSDIYSKKAESD